MQKGILLLFFLNFILFCLANAQDERQKGLMFSNNSKDSSEIWFTKEFTAKQNIYVIYSSQNSSSPLCTIMLKYNSTSEVINVNIEDGEKVDYIDIPFSHDISACIVKNSKTNDTTVSKIDKCDILFTIKDIANNREEINLNQIASSNHSIIYQLIPLRKTYIDKHIDSCKEYYKKQQEVINHSNSSSSIYESNLLLINALLKKTGISSDPYIMSELMLSVKNYDHVLSATEITNLIEQYDKRAVKIKKMDSLKSVIRKDKKYILDELIANETNTRHADKISESMLKDVLDSVFIKYYDSIVVKIKNWKLDLTINTDNKGIVLLPVFDTCNWIANDMKSYSLIDIYINNVKPVISNIIFVPQSDIYKRKGYYYKIWNKYMDECKEIDMGAFTELFDSIKVESAAFVSKEISFSIIYNYQFIYTSTTTSEPWLIKKDGSFIEFENSEPVGKDKQNLFVQKYPSYKTGRFKVTFYEAFAAGKSLPLRIVNCIKE